MARPDAAAAAGAGGEALGRRWWSIGRLTRKLRAPAALAGLGLRGAGAAARGGRRAPGVPGALRPRVCPWRLLDWRFSVACGVELSPLSVFKFRDLPQRRAAPHRVARWRPLPTPPYRPRVTRVAAVPLTLFCGFPPSLLPPRLYSGANATS